MSQERHTNPLPKGRYWITVLGDNIPDFDAWLLDMHNAVKVETSELDVESHPPSEFIIFRVVSDAAFLNAEQFGFPEKAPSSVKTRDDAEKAPVVDEPGTEDLLKYLKTAGKVAAGLFLAKLVVDLVRK